MRLFKAGLFVGAILLLLTFTGGCGGTATDTEAGRNVVWGRPPDPPKTKGPALK